MIQFVRHIAIALSVVLPFPASLIPAAVWFICNKTQK